MNNPSTQAEMLKVEQTQLKVTLYKDAVSDAGNGFGLKDRINDSTCKVVVTADEGVRGGKSIPLFHSISIHLLSR